jgi:signal transduction histidine kinase
VQCIQDSLEFLREAFETVAPVLDRYRELAGMAGGQHSELVESVRAAEESSDLAYLIEASPPAARRGLEMVRRIVEIVRATKDFAGPEGDGTRAVDVQAAIRAVLDIARPLFAGVAEVELDGAALSLVGHPRELNEALRHLIINAAHAIADAGRRGTIRIHTGLDAGDVVIAVSDDGCGIPAAIAHRVFDPFFTTKDVGRGVGLGLFVASAAARHHGGTLTFDSEPGHGTTFRLRLPGERLVQP